MLLQPLWDFFIKVFGKFISSPGFILTAVMLGVYCPGFFFSFIDVFVAKRLTLKQSLDIYRRAMKFYSTVYFLSLPLFILSAPRDGNIPIQAPALAAFASDLVLYFLVGDFASYIWHRVEHSIPWYNKYVHCVHHSDRPPLSIWSVLFVSL